MFQKLIKTETPDINGQTYRIDFYETITVHGTRRFSSQITLGAADRIVLDDDSVDGLKLKIARLLPVTVYGRLLAAKARVAA